MVWRLPKIGAHGDDIANPMEPSVAPPEAIERFAAALRGDLVRPADPDYDKVRALYNAMIDKKPALIAVHGMSPT